MDPGPFSRKVLAAFSGQLDAQTQNGRVHSNLDVTTPVSNTRTRIAGTLGSGGAARVRVTTANGDVALNALD